MNATFWRFVAATLLALPSLRIAVADGPQDNLIENVRRIPALGVEVPADRAASLRNGLTQLQEKIAAVRASKDAAKIALLPDVMIFERAVRVALDHQEFFEPKDIDKGDGLIREGLTRADQLLAGQPAWVTQTGPVVRGYISRLDATVQPYGLIVPTTYDFDHSAAARCDLWFHGRGEKLSEVNFLWDRMRSVGEFAPPHTIVLHPYGRYSNAFKFAGEVDVLEALADVQLRYRIDEDRIAVRGFSMGGAGCWQFATHYADRFFAAAPGAGFSETPRFLKVFQKEELHPTLWEERLWGLYDCDKWALNLTHCPTIAYSGENDSQKQAADVMEEALAALHIPLRHIIGAGMGHKYDPVSKGIIEDSLRTLATRGRDRSPGTIRMTTQTLKYNRMHAARIDGMNEHWKPATLEATWGEATASDPDPKVSLDVNLSNVSAFGFDFPAGELPLRQETLAKLWRSGGEISLVIHALDANGKAGPVTRTAAGRPASDGSFRIAAHQNDQGQWVVGPPAEGLRKRHGLQGPIDDALMDSFVFVRPTGTAAHPAVAKWVDAELARAIEHWRRHFRGDAIVVDDDKVTDAMIASSNLILWGDPNSNRLIAKVIGDLPVGWDNDKVTVGDRSFPAAEHLPILVYPNPLNPARYVVLNSSFTFREYAYLNNARQVPMLPDWAVIDLKTPPNAVWPGKVVAADFFDERWRIK
jgi:hypothetical protein